MTDGSSFLALYKGTTGGSGLDTTDLDVDTLQVDSDANVDGDLDVGGDTTFAGAVAFNGTDPLTVAGGISTPGSTVLAKRVQAESVYTDGLRFQPNKYRRLTCVDTLGKLHASDTTAPLEFKDTYDMLGEFTGADLKIAPGSNGQVLATDGAEVKWVTPPAPITPPVTSVAAAATPNGVVVTPTTGAVTVALDTAATPTVAGLTDTALAGAGTRMVTADATGTLGSTALPVTSLTVHDPFATLLAQTGPVTLEFKTGTTAGRVLTEVLGGQPSFQALPAAPVTSVAAAASPNGITVMPTTGDVKVGLSTSSDVEVKTLTVRPTGTDNGLNIISTVPAPFIGLTWNGVRQCYMGVPFAGAGAGGTFTSEVGSIVLAVPAAKQVIARVNGKDILSATEYDLGITASQTLFSSTAAMITSYYQSGIRQGYLGSRANWSGAGLGIVCEQNDMIQSFPTGRKIVFQENYADRMSVDGAGIKFEQAGMKNGVLVSDANGRVSATSSEVKANVLVANWAVLSPTFRTGDFELAGYRLSGGARSSGTSDIAIRWDDQPMPGNCAHIRIHFRGRMQNWGWISMRVSEGGVTDTDLNYRGGKFQRGTGGVNYLTVNASTNYPYFIECDTNWGNDSSSEITIYDWARTGNFKSIRVYEAMGQQIHEQSITYMGTLKKIGGLVLSVPSVPDVRWTVFAF